MTALPPPEVARSVPVAELPAELRLPPIERARTTTVPGPVPPAPSEAQPAVRPQFGIESFRVMTNTLLGSLAPAERAGVLQGLKVDVDRFVTSALPANLEAIPRERTGLVVAALRRAANEASDALMQLPGANSDARRAGMARLASVVDAALVEVASRHGVSSDAMRAWLAREHGLAFNGALTTHAEDGQGTADIQAGISDLVPRSRQIQRANLLVEVTPRPDLTDDRTRAGLASLFPGVEPPVVYATTDPSFTWVGANASQVPMFSEPNLRSGIPHASEAEVRARLLETAANELGHATFDRATGGRGDGFRWLDPDPDKAFTRGYEVISDAISSQVAPRPLSAMLDTEDDRYSESRKIAGDFLRARGIDVDISGARLARRNGTLHRWLEMEAVRAGTTYARLNEEFRASVLETARGYLVRDGIGTR